MQENLRELGMTQVDLVLLHHPCATAADNIGLWKGLEQALAQNLTRAIGVRGRPTRDRPIIVVGSMHAARPHLLAISLRRRADNSPGRAWRRADARSSGAG